MVFNSVISLIFFSSISVSLLCASAEVRQTKKGTEVTAAGLFAPCSVEPFINYGERAGVVRAASRVAARKERGVGYVDREARAASEASIELASFPVATALKPLFATFKRSAACRDITEYRHLYRTVQNCLFSKTAP